MIFSANGDAVQFHSSENQFRPKVTIAYTGQDTDDRRASQEIAKYLGNDELFMLTYGDGVTDLNIDSLVKFHKSHGKLATLTAVNPPPKFGNLQLMGTWLQASRRKRESKGG